ncbi:MAG: hypothetical protein KJ864_01920 [Candidatus Omnitrophica bacterium]|nr:hypothetical protein [Candidatus Omnitrophota bacterium]MBU1894930.1 hypothetical protein [Candidatus Omnitrophota bacterium]
MKLHKIIFSGILITVMAVGYVHQRIEIVKAGYTLQKNIGCLTSLVDQNSKLMYNLSKLESPGYLLASLSGQEIEFANHRTEGINNYQLASRTIDKGVLGGSLIERFFDVFTLNAEARPRE